MKFSEKWLREWVNPPVSPEELSNQLTMAGLEVEGVKTCQPGFADVVAARVVQVDEHPRADRLSICLVDDGSEEALTIVCGAANVRAGRNYPLARIGARLPGGNRIAKTEIKKVSSEGMLCSGAELGFTDDSDSIMELGDDARPGTALEQYLGLDDRQIELSLTPNRGDCLSIRGIAREVGVMNEMAVDDLSISKVASELETTLQISLESPDGCPRYAGRVIEGVQLYRKSPLWLTEKLRRSDIRSINPVVDVTNYVMLELGQPMHAFDLDLVKGGIHVRYARPGETLVMLDGEQVELTADTLVIADDGGAVAMAGIMGGRDSGVTGETTRVFLESAFFSPEVIMGRARRYGLHTDSSHRFERGVDYELQVTAIERATALILSICGGKAGPVTDVVEPDHLPQSRTIHLRKAQVGNILGVAIEAPVISGILARLDMKSDEKLDSWDVNVPPFRFDVSQETDLIEEIARVYGYEHVPSTPISADLRIHRNNNFNDLNELRNILKNRGYYETVTYSFIDSNLQDLVLGKSSTSITLQNPISSDLNVMRRSLWPGLLVVLQYNLKRQQQRVRIFEYGRVFSRSESEVSQDQKLSGLICGNNMEIQWDNSNSLSNFYDMKGDIEALVNSGNSGLQIDYRDASHPALHPGRSAEIIIDNQCVGLCGAIHPKIMKALELNHPVYVFELDSDHITPRIERKYQKISKFPYVKRDISILVDKNIPVAQIINTIWSASPELLNNLELFDVYLGEGIDILKKSLALGLTFQASSSTLIDEEVEGEVENILSALSSEYGVKLRE